MAGVSGTSKSKKVYYYYVCPTARAKQGCTKKKVPRDWIENLVVKQTVQYLLQPDKIKSLAHKLYEYQLAQDTSRDDIKIFKQKLSENKNAIANLITLIEKGNTSQAIGDRITQLENEQSAIQDKINELSFRPPALAEEQIETLLQKFLNANESPEGYKQRIIKGFISAVYLYDDKLFIYYNIKDGETLAESELLFDENVFDESCVCSTRYAICRTPNAALITNARGILLAVRIKDEQ